MDGRLPKLNGGRSFEVPMILVLYRDRIFGRQETDTSGEMGQHSAKASGDVSPISDVAPGHLDFGLPKAAAS